MGTVEWIVLTIIGVLGGAGLGFWLGKRAPSDDSAKLADVEAELNAYRDRVSEHFSQSATHFQAIGRQYRDLYEHMAAGSEKLCERTESDNQHRFPRPDEVLVENAESLIETGSALESEPVDYVADSEDGTERKPDEAAAASPELTTTSDATTADETAGAAAAETAVEDSDGKPQSRLYH